MDDEELMALIGNARVRFWQCPLHTGGMVRWTEDVAECCSCGFKSSDSDPKSDATETPERAVKATS